ncbi:hypothetical protein ACFX11_025408 [Malus domestica]
MQSEMKFLEGSDTEALKQHFGKKILELEDEKRTVQQDRDRLLGEVENLSVGDGQQQKFQDVHTQKLKALEGQILDLKKKQESQVQLLKQKRKSSTATKDKTRSRTISVVESLSREGSVAEADYQVRQEIDFFGEISGASMSSDDESLYIGIWD